MKPFLGQRFCSEHRAVTLGLSSTTYGKGGRTKFGVLHQLPSCLRSIWEQIVTPPEIGRPTLFFFFFMFFLLKNIKEMFSEC